MLFHCLPPQGFWEEQEKRGARSPEPFRVPFEGGFALMLGNLAAQLHDATPAAVAELVASLSEDERTRVRQAMSILERSSQPSGDSEGKVTYYITMVDGSELETTLNKDATLKDAIISIASIRNAKPSQIRLLAAGQSQPLRLLTSRLYEATEGCTELMAILSTAYRPLGDPVGPLSSNCTETTFEHFAISVYLEHDESGTVSADETSEICDGQRIICDNLQRDAVGALFREGPPLSGKVLIRLIIERRHYALGLGVATADMALNADAEYCREFFGLYHGGHSTNVCMYGRRTMRNGPKPNSWDDGKRVAVLLDLNEHTMQCYDGKEPLGPKFPDLPEEDLWPMLVLWRQRDCVTISVSSV